MGVKNSLPGLRVLVTGGARRIGAAVVKRLHRAGMQTAIHCRRSVDEAERLCAVLNAERAGSASVHHGDLLAETVPSRLVEDVVARHGGLDVLINNASSFYPTPVSQTTAAQWEDLLATNLKAPFFLSQAAAPHLAERSGSIVNMVDIYGVRPLIGYPVYSIAKAGLIMMTKTLARELAPRVRVNAIAPGAILWPEQPVEEDEETRRRLLERTPLGTDGDPDDIAAAALFLIRESGFITGQTITVDGGRTIVQG